MRLFSIILILCLLCGGCGTWRSYKRTTEWGWANYYPVCPRCGTSNRDNFKARSVIKGKYKTEIMCPECRAIFEDIECERWTGQGRIPKGSRKVIKRGKL